MQTYLLILHLHFLPCPPHLPLPQSHYLPLHFQYHLLNHSYLHQYFLKKKREEERKYIFDAGRQAGRNVKKPAELLLTTLFMK